MQIFVINQDIFSIILAGVGRWLMVIDLNFPKNELIEN